MHPYVHSGTIYNNQVLETKWVDQKTLVFTEWNTTQQKEGTPTFFDSMDTLFYF